MVIILIVLHIVVCGLFVLVPDEQGMPFFGLIGMALLLGGSYLEGDNLLDQWWGRLTQGLRITIAKLGYMGSFVSRSNPDFCRTVLRLSDSVVTNTAYCYLRNII